MNKGHKTVNSAELLHIVESCLLIGIYCTNLKINLIHIFSAPADTHMPHPIINDNRMGRGKQV